MHKYSLINRSQIIKKYTNILLVSNIYFAASYASLMVDDTKLCHKKNSHRSDVKKYYVSNPPLGLFDNKTNVHARTPNSIRKIFYNCAPVVHTLSENHDSLSQHAAPNDPRRECEDEDEIFDVVTDEQTDFIEIDQKNKSFDLQNITEVANNRINENSDEEDFVLISND